MALRATPYKVHLELSDTDRGVYESLHMTVARHPSETEERLTTRILAFGLWYEEHLTFGRGLSDVDEPALWSKRLDDQIEHWVEVGRPSAERLVWCARRYPRVSLLAYGNHQTWAGGVLPQVAGMHNLHIALLPQAPLDQLSSDLPRSIDWGLMITDDVLYVSRAEQQHELPLQWLQGSRS
ncbi:MAG: YaeQ family protein [Wenzhouxiangella sp.]|nr:YaeQ family protein [Wenzhouxiangella sp.]MCH8478745.1 YaeQ family protein [Wenzhouxiangella sp.]